MHTTIYFGPPGTGKTETVLGCVRDEIERGTRPDRIAFVSFSRRASQEARERARSQLGLDGDDLRYWHTLHSTAARQLGVRGSLIDGAAWKDLGRLLDMEFGDVDEAGRTVSRLHERGAKCQMLYGLARATQRPLKEVWEDHGRKVEDWPVVSLFARTLEAYCREHELLDYHDLLDRAPGGLPVDAAVIDEAQDLTPAQWGYAMRAFSGVDRLYVAGDDDQAIFQWAGADVRKFLDLPGERIVLGISHRLPRAVFDVADGITSRIALRQPKRWKPSPRDGDVFRVSWPDDVPVHEGQWLLLGRTRAILDNWEVVCRSAGVRYVRMGVDSVRSDEARAIRAWETLRRGGDVLGSDAQVAIEMTGRKVRLNDDERYSRADLDLVDMPIWHQALKSIPPARRRYYEACLRRSTRALTDPPRVTISTVHGAKGGEAKRVAILTDSTPRISEGLWRDPDAEHRVWYVGVTRAAEELWIVRPLTEWSYPI